MTNASKLLKAKTLSCGLYKIENIPPNSNSASGQVAAAPSLADEAVAAALAPAAAEPGLKSMMSCWCYREIPGGRHEEDAVCQVASLIFA